MYIYNGNRSPSFLRGHTHTIRSKRNQERLMAESRVGAEQDGHPLSKQQLHTRYLNSNCTLAYSHTHKHTHLLSHTHAHTAVLAPRADNMWTTVVRFVSVGSKRRAERATSTSRETVTKTKLKTIRG
eukprot:sb/3475509/